MDQRAPAARTRAPDPSPVGFFSLATAGALFTVLVWGGSPLVSKIGTVNLDGLTLAVLRTTVSMPFALLLIVAMRLKLPWRGTDKFWLLAVAVAGLIGFPVLFTMGVALTTSGHAAVAAAATPVFAGLLDAAWQRRWPRRRWWIGVSVAFSGAVLLIAEAMGLSDAAATWQGDVLVIGGSFCASLSFIFASKLTPRYGTPAMAMWSVVAATVILLPVQMIVLPPAAFLDFGLREWFAVLYLSAGASIFAFIAWFYALNAGGIARMSVWQFCVPVVGIILSTVILHEPLTPMLVGAAAVILSGVFLVQRR